MTPGEGVVWGPGQPRPTHQHQKNFPQAKSEIYSRGRKFEADFRYTNFFWPLTPPPPSSATRSNGLLPVKRQPKLSKCHLPLVSQQSKGFDWKELQWTATMDRTSPSYSPALPAPSPATTQCIPASPSWLVFEEPKNAARRQWLRLRKLTRATAAGIDIAVVGRRFTPCLHAPSTPHSTFQYCRLLRARNARPELVEVDRRASRAEPASRPLFFFLFGNRLMPKSSFSRAARLNGSAIRQSSPPPTASAPPLLTAPPCLPHPPPCLPHPPPPPQCLPAPLSWLVFEVPLSLLSVCAVFH